MSMVLFMPASEAADFLKAYDKVKNSISGDHTVKMRTEPGTNVWYVSLEADNYRTFLELCAYVYAEIPVERVPAPEMSPNRPQNDLAEDGDPVAEGDEEEDVLEGEEETEDESPESEISRKLGKKYVVRKAVKPAEQPPSPEKRLAEAASVVKTGDKAVTIEEG